MSNVQNLEISRALQQLQNEYDAVSNAILSALGQPVDVNIIGSMSYTNRSLDELYSIRDRITIDIQALRTGTTITRTLPRWVRAGSGVGGGLGGSTW